MLWEFYNFFQKHVDVKIRFQKLFQVAGDAAVNDKDRQGCFVVNPNDLETLDILKKIKPLSNDYSFLLLYIISHSSPQL